MVHIESNYRITATSGTYHVHNFQEIENGVILHESHTTLTHGHGFISVTQTGKLVLKYIADILAITGNVDISLSVVERPSGDILASKLITVNSIGIHTLELVFRGGGKTGPPTYLEELSKLDQYSKAQYIPR